MFYHDIQGKNSLELFVEVEVMVQLLVGYVPIERTARKQEQVTKIYYRYSQ